MLNIKDESFENAHAPTRVQIDCFKESQRDWLWVTEWKISWGGQLESHLQLASSFSDRLVIKTTSLNHFITFGVW